MANRAVFMDRDNTIIANDGYLGDPAGVKLLPGAATAIASLRRLGYRIVVVSNQSGVARGLFDEAAVKAVNDEMCRQLKRQADALVDAIYYSPHHPDAPVAEYRQDHPWRKPKPGMLLHAASELNLDLNQSWMIGDQPRDVDAGASAGCRTILLGNLQTVVAGRDGGAQPDFVVASLADAARIIVREGANPPPEPPASGAASVQAPATPGERETSEPVVTPQPPSQQLLAGAAPVAGAVGSVGNAAAAATDSGTHLDILEQMLQQLRHLNHGRHSHEFTREMFLAAMVQLVAILFLAMAAWDAVAALNVPMIDANWWFNKTSEQLGAIEWLLAALVCEVLVLVLLRMGQSK
ncbi:MAG: HAD family hydrolase [Phycisphaerales bacterium]|nr:HAD family hydrolase [Phycisphaerales bacterium]